MVQRVTVPLAFDFRSWWDSSAWTIPEVSQQLKTMSVHHGAENCVFAPWVLQVLGHGDC